MQFRDRGDVKTAASSAIDVRRGFLWPSERLAAAFLQLTQLE